MARVYTPYYKNDVIKCLMFSFALTELFLSRGAGGEGEGGGHSRPALACNSLIEHESFDKARHHFIFSGTRSLDRIMQMTTG